MTTYFKHHQDPELFGEKRLVYRDANPSLTDARDARRRDRPKHSPPLTPEQILKRTKDQLRDLEEQSKNGPKRTPPQANTRTHGATRELTPPPTHYPRSVEVARQAERMRGVMSPIELQRMQGTHQKLYEHYINPAFILHLKQINKSDAVFNAINLVLEHPALFEYRNMGGDNLKILKKRPYTEANSAIPNDFMILLKTNEGRISAIQPSADPSHYINLEMGDGSIAWMNNPTYNAEMERYRLRFNSEVVRYRDAQTPANKREAKSQLQDALDNASPAMREIFELENADFPRRLVDLIRKRDLGWEVNDPQYIDLVTHLARQGRNYDELTRNNMEGWHVTVRADPKNPGVYLVATRASLTRVGQFLLVNKEGYIMVESQGRLTPDPRYGQAVIRKYYRENPQAWDSLTETERGDLTRSGARIEQDRQALERAARARAEQERATRNRNAVNTAVERADIDTLKSVSKAIHPGHDEQIDEVTDADQLRTGINAILNNDPSQLPVAAAALRLTLEPPPAQN